MNKKFQSKNPMKKLVKESFGKKTTKRCAAGGRISPEISVLKKPMPKFAAGGVAKIRHNQATADGKPKKPKVGKLGNPYK